MKPLVSLVTGCILIFSCKSSEPASKPLGEKNEIAEAVQSDPSLAKKLQLLDVNDVSILFDYKKTSPGLPSSSGAFTPNAHMVPDLSLSEFISETTFQEILGAARAETLELKISDPNSSVGADQFDRWKIISLRFDPCAPSAALANGEIPAELSKRVPGCIVQLRLIAQPLSTAGQGNLDNPDNPAKYWETVPRDHTMHLVYNLGVFKGSKDTETLQKNFAPFLPVIEGLLKIKTASKTRGVDTNGAIMSVHPGLQSERDSQATEVSDAIANFIRNFAKKDGMQIIAFMGVHGSIGPWRFLTGNLIKDKDGIPRLLVEKLPEFSDSNKKSQIIPNLGASRISPVALLTDGPTRKLSTYNMQFKTDAGEVTKDAIEIENPLTTHALNMDCASCHTLQFPIYGQFGTKFTRAVNQLESLPDGRYKVPQGISAYTATRSLSRWNFHNFAYFVDVPTISPRTVSETDAVVQLTNRLIGGDLAINPGLDCGQDPKVLAEIFRCGMKKECFSACKVNTPGL